MAKREELDKDLHCPDCGKKGTLTWSENENPMHAGARNDPQIVSISEGFVTGPERGHDRLPVIECRKCGTSVG
jgi:hypothetical protein